MVRLFLLLVSYLRTKKQYNVNPGLAEDLKKHYKEKRIPARIITLPGPLDGAIVVSRKPISKVFKKIFKSRRKRS